MSTPPRQTDAPDINHASKCSREIDLESRAVSVQQFGELCVQLDAAYALLAQGVIEAEAVTGDSRLHPP
jgi:hypothetical protein